MQPFFKGFMDKFGVLIAVCETSSGSFSIVFHSLFFWSSILLYLGMFVTNMHLHIIYVYIEKKLIGSGI